MKNHLEALISAHLFFTDESAERIRKIAAFSEDMALPINEYLFKEDDPADKFYLLIQGSVALETHHNVRGPRIVDTVLAGGVVGWSWLFPPYRWLFDAIALENGRCVVVDAVKLKDECEYDHEFGYRMMKKMLGVVSRRLHSARIQLLDVYR